MENKNLKIEKTSEKLKESNEEKEPGFMVYDFMGADLKLKGPTLVVFALIYSFSVSGNYEFYATRAYIANRCGISLSSVSRAIKELIDKKLIIKIGASASVPNVTVYRADSYLVGLVLAEMDKRKKQKEQNRKTELFKTIREEHRATDYLDIEKYVNELQKNPTKECAVR